MKSKQLPILSVQERDCIALKLIKCRKPVNDVVTIYRMTPELTVDFKILLQDTGIFPTPIF